MTIGSLLEVPPTTTLQSIDNPAFRSMIAHWSNVTVFLIFNYRNVFVVNMIAPISPLSNLTSFSQLGSFQFSTHRRKFKIGSKQPNNETNIHCAAQHLFCSCFNLINFLAESEISPSPDLHLSKLYRKKLNTTSNSVLQHDFLITRYHASRGDQLAKSYKALSICRRKALIKDVDILDTFIEYAKLKDIGIKFRKEKESVYKIPLMYRRWNSEYFYCRFQRLMQSGIYQIFTKMRNYYHPNGWKRKLTELEKSTGVRNTPGVRAHSLQTSIFTLFFVYLLCVGGGIVSFFM